MNELVQLVMQKTGLPQDKAQEVVDTVVNHLKSRLPESLTSHLSGLLGGADGSPVSGLEDKAKSAMAGLGGMFGKQTE